MKEAYIPALRALTAAAATLEASTASLNTIFQFVESYAQKYARIRDIHLGVERQHLGVLITQSSLYSSDAADVICKWMETEAAKSTHRSYYLGHVAEMVLSSIRLFVTDSTIFNALKSAVTGSKPEPGTN